MLKRTIIHSLYSLSQPYPLKTIYLKDLQYFRDKAKSFAFSQNERRPIEHK